MLRTLVLVLVLPAAPALVSRRATLSRRTRVGEVPSARAGLNWSARSASASARPRRRESSLVVLDASGYETVERRLEQREDEDQDESSPSASLATFAAAASPETAQLARPSQQSWTFEYVRRKLWTKLDYGHTHAISGAAFLIVGVGWLIAAAVAQEWSPGGAETLLPSTEGGAIWGAAPSLAILGVGVWNSISALPMASDDRVYVTKDLDRYHALAFKWGGSAQLVACAWLCWWFSGLYPNFGDAQLVGTVVDDALCLAAMASIAWVIYFSEESITSLRRKRREGGWVHGRRAQDLDDNEVGQLTALARLGSYPNLFQLPVLVNVLLGGRAWFYHVAHDFPWQHALLHHYLFACAISYAITFFATTLRDRNMISITQDLAMLATGTVMPFATMFLDTHSFPHQTTLNPFDYNVGFI